MRRIDHIVMTGITALTLLLVAIPALAQPPDTLRLAPCEIVALGDAGPELLRGRWLRLDVDPLTMLRLLDSSTFEKLEEIAANVAPFPLDDFVPLVLNGLDSAKSWRDISRDIGEKHGLEYEYDIDPELLYEGMTMLQSARLVKVFLVEMAEKKPDNVAVVTVHVRSNDGVGRKISIVTSPLLVRHVAGMKEGSRESLVVESERSDAWIRADDSIAVSSWIDRSAIDAPHVFSFPSLNDIDGEFFRMEKSTADALNEVIPYPGTNSIHPLQWIFFHILARMDSDTSLSQEEFRRKATSFLCSLPHFDCDTLDNFADSATWRRVGTLFRETLHRYLALPHRLYAVVAADTVSAFLAFPIDTTRTTPIILTRDEMEATPALRGTDWHERLMRSIREEECWAERMEGF